MLAACLRLAGNHEPGDIVALVPIAEGWATSSALWASLILASTLVTIGVSRDRHHRQHLRP